MVDVPRGGAARLARVAHNHKVAGSNPAPATKKDFELVSEPFLLHHLVIIFTYTLLSLTYYTYIT